MALKNFPQEDSSFRKPYLWCFTTYFAEGFPYSIIRAVSSVFFRDMRVPLESIGLTSLYGLPWILKFFWGPQVDEFGSKRKWLLSMQGLITLLFLVTAFAVPLPGSTRIIAVLFFIGAFIAATHDIAIDGYYLAALDLQGQAKFVGYRIMAYRMALMTGSMVIITLSVTRGWFLGFLAAAFIMILLFVYHLLFLPECEMEKQPISKLWRTLFQSRFLPYLIGAVILVTPLVLYLRSIRSQTAKPALFLKEVWLSRGISFALLGILLLMALFRRSLTARITRNPHSFYARSFLSFMDQPKIGIILAFIVLVRAGEFMLTSMVPPFMVDLGIKIHYGWISGGVSIPSSIAGAMLGGWLISRHGMKKMIWPFLLAQNLTNLVYMALAFGMSGYLAANTGAIHPIPLPVIRLAAVAGVHGFDQFASGLGSAVLITFIMRLCRAEFKAAHFAIGSGLMSLSGVFAGIGGGLLASWLGYGMFFGISFLFSLPGMALIFFIPKE